MHTCQTPLTIIIIIIISDSRIPQNILRRENLRQVLASNGKKCHRFGLNTKEKRLHKKIRHYTMKIVNFNAILLHDKPKNEYFLVFHRPKLSFNANIANFYFSGVANNNNTSNAAVKRRKGQCKKMARKYLIKKQQNVCSFKGYLSRAIKKHYLKYLDGKHSLISVHAIFTVNNSTKSKVFITRDIVTYSDIGKFINMIDSFDPTSRWNVVKKMEDCLKKLNITMNNVLVFAQISQTRKNLFIQWNDRLVQSLHRRNIKVQETQLINTNVLNIRLDHIRFNGSGYKNVNCLMKVFENLVSKKLKRGNIEKKLETQLNSCKNFIACLDAFENNKMSEIRKIPFSSELQAFIASDLDSKAEMKENAGDTGDPDIDSFIRSDDKFQGILSKIDTLQKRIRTHVKTSPCLHIEPVDEDGEQARLLEKLEGSELEGSQQDVVKRDTFQKSKFCKPEILRKDSNVLQSNLMKIEEYLKRDFQKNKQQIEGNPIN